MYDLSVKSLGVLVDNLVMSQKTFSIISNLNRYIEETGNEAVVFHLAMAPVAAKTKFSIMEVTEAWPYKGMLISTSLPTTEKLIQFPGPRRKIFYVYDLEWVFGDFPFNYLNSIYNNREIEIAVRSQYHAELFEQSWKRKPNFVLEDFGFEQLKTLVESWNPCA